MDCIKSVSKLLAYRLPLSQQRHYYINGVNELIGNVEAQKRIARLGKDDARGIFVQLVRDYIRSTGMTQQEVEELLEAMKHLGEYPYCTHTHAYKY